MLDGHGQNGSQSSLLVKQKLPQTIADHITQLKKEQKLAGIKEPDPEEKEDVGD